MNKTMLFSKETTEFLRDYTIEILSKKDYDLRLSYNWERNRSYKVHIYALTHGDLIAYVCSLDVLTSYDIYVDHINIFFSLQNKFMEILMIASTESLDYHYSFPFLSLAALQRIRLKWAYNLHMVKRCCREHPLV